MNLTVAMPNPSTSPARTSWPVLLVLSWWVAVPANLAQGQQSSGSAPADTRSQWSDDLLDRLLPPPRSGAAPSDAVPAPSVSGEDLGARRSPVGEIRRRMTDVAKRLEAGRVDDTTQDMQMEILAALERLLPQDETQSAGSPQMAPSADQPQRRQQQEDSPAAGGSDVRRQDDESEARDSLRAVWGQLPERLRAEIQAPLREAFLPAYRDLIIDYYKRLAQQPFPTQ